MEVSPLCHVGGVMVIANCYMPSLLPLKPSADGKVTLFKSKQNETKHILSVCDAYLDLTFHVLIQSVIQWVLKLFCKAKSLTFGKWECIYPFNLSRKEAEIFLFEILVQENIIVKELCGMGRWNQSLPKWRRTIFIPVIAMWYFKNVSSWAVGTSTFCNTNLEVRLSVIISK